MKMFFATALLALSATASFATDVNVFAAASMKGALDKIGAAYKAKSGNNIVATYGATGTLAKQIQEAAPADIFISADKQWMDTLAEKKMIKDDTRFVLAGNTLVLIKSIDDKTVVAIGKIGDALGADGKLALGDIKSVPAGKYAKAALDKLGQWASVESHVVMQENVRAALALVARGEAKLGIVYGSDVKAEPKVEVAAMFDEASHPPIVYPAAIVAASTNTDAPGFMDFLKSADAKAILEKDGFTLAK